MNITEEQNTVLTTEPFDKQHKKYPEIHPDLVQPSFSLLLVGPKGSGKSNLILRLLFGNKKPKSTKKGNTHYKFYRHFFDKVYIFSPSWNLDPKMERCKIPDEQIYDDPELYPEIIEEIIGTQTDSIEEESKDECEHVLMVFTDLAGAKGVFSQSKGIMNKLAFNLRHFKISLVIDTQSLRQINPAFRENLSGVVLFSGINNRLELEKVKEEFLGFFDKKEQDKILDFAFQKPYDFLYINFQKFGLERYFRNFNKMIISRVKEK